MVVVWVYFYDNEKFVNCGFVIVVVNYRFGVVMLVGFRIWEYRNFKCDYMMLED